ncbi:hypothetical protein [Paracoccus aminophilus]|uniref:hypothetical protein n=1 Tax=Paracoccus aminophilus TaxID=34003 RepID=UPI00041A7D3B|nr:hypothetical protein [Paracoccus aminophilus]
MLQTLSGGLLGARKTDALSRVARLLFRRRPSPVATETSELEQRERALLDQHNRSEAWRLVGTPMRWL